MMFSTTIIGFGGHL